MFDLRRNPKAEVSRIQLIQENTQRQIVEYNVRVIPWVAATEYWLCDSKWQE